MYKWDAVRKCASGAAIVFVDDGRCTGKDKEHAWRVFHQCSSKLQFLGIQIAIRKVRPPHASKAGAWAGTIIQTSQDRVDKSVAQDKWDKAQRILNEMISELESTEDGLLDHADS